MSFSIGLPAILKFGNLPLPYDSTDSEITSSIIIHSINVCVQYMNL